MNREQPADGELSLGVDVGGTFTDAVLTAGGALHTSKVPTTPADQSQGVMAAVQLVLDSAGIAAGEVTHFGHGMTVATNALLEERGARTALVATRGFEDVVEIARQARPQLYRLCEAPPTPLVPPELRFGARERCSPDGVLEPLDPESAKALAAEVAKAGVEAIAVSLLHAYAHPQHERLLATELASALPDVHVSTSSDLSSVFREYERTSTTVIDAYLGPLLRRYLEQMAARATEAGLPEPEIMQSNGGLIDSGLAARHPAWTLLSGPAAGTIAAAFLASQAGDEQALSFDMGGTSCDVALIEGGEVRQAAQRSIGSRVVQLPMIDVHTVGAGGGSIGWDDAGGALRVGPRSAGAEPGPACYGRGGTEPTVTDANLALGYLGPDSELAGGLRLDIEAAREAVSRLGRRLGLDVEQTAAGMLRVADLEMVRALRVVSVERGVDPRGHALVAFGGAGPMHATRIADELEVTRVLCPRSAGVLSALGLAASDRRRDFARSVMLSGESLCRERVVAAVEELSGVALEHLPAARLEARFDLRYAGQGFELPVPVQDDFEPRTLHDAFDRVHSDHYGYADPSAELELVNVRVAAISERPRPTLAVGSSRTPTIESRDAMFGDRWLDTLVVRGDPEAGRAIEGPAVLELAEATAVVPPGWSARIDQQGTTIMERRS
ncbi:MAG: hydantoinase/oxoprolinase family protein [Solirubrobacterales bacterium]